jgi:antitoxin ParD1/3/4
VKSGRYQNASEVLCEGLRLIELREAREAAKLEAGRFLDFASFNEFEDHLIRATEDALKAKPL